MRYPPVGSCNCPKSVQPLLPATAARVPGRAGESLRWTLEEDARLAALFRQGETQLDIARALPARTWGSIEQRYRKVVAPADRFKMWRRQMIKKGETYEEYMRRPDKRR